MSSEWEYAPLGEVCSRITYGFTNPMPTIDGEGAYMVTAKDIKNGRIQYQTARKTSWDAYRDKLTDKSRPSKGDLLLTKDGSIGRLALCDRDDICINQSVALLQSNGKGDFRYIKYLLEAPEYQRKMESDSDGSTIKHIYITRVDKMMIPLPPRKEQEGISHILATLDDKIELNRKTNETLEAIARALFKSWFVDFDPVRAKAEGRPTGLPAEISDLFPDSFEDSELGEIPSGWSAKKIGEISKKVTTRIGARSAVVLSAVKNGTLQRSDDYFTKKVYSNSIGKYIEVLPFDIAFNPSRINIGSIGINTVVELGAVSPVYIVSRSRKNWHWFLWESISVNRIKEAVKVLCSGSVRQSLSSDDFESIQIACPDSEDLIFQFNANYEVNLNRINAINENIRSLECVRDALLPKLISGEIRIPDAEKMLEEIGV